MRPGARIDYKALRKINAEAARQAALEYLKTNGGNLPTLPEYSATQPQEIGRPNSLQFPARNPPTGFRLIYRGTF
jgi:hypothetical protein